VDDVAFGRYRLIELIGEGGMGKVYKAHDTVMGRDVAIKVLPRELATNPGYEERFRREASVAARLTEPHIIPIFEAGEIDGQLYLVMPVISGIDVQTVLRHEGPMSPQRAVQVVEQLAAALNAAHQHGLVHRDVKPSNALLTGDDFVYLIDFGIAHDAAATRLTSTGMMVGTLAYMAPERFTDGTADARADVYSLTCVLYECLTGGAPYPGNSIEQQIAGHLSLDPPKPSAQRPDVPVGFDEVIAVGMAKNPDRRYQSARELAVAARGALGAASTPARDPHSGPTLLADRTVPTGVSDVLSSPPARGPEPSWQQPAHFNYGGIQQRPYPVESAGSPPWQPAGPPPWQPAPRGDRNRWRVPGVTSAVVAAIALAGAGIYFATNKSNPAPTPTSTIAAAPTLAPAPTSAIAGGPPVGEAVLDGLLLSPDQLNAIMGTTKLANYSANQVWINSSGYVSPPECLPLNPPLQKDAYAGSSQTAARSQALDEFNFAAPDKNHSHVGQGVVLFPAAQAATTFVSASLQSWSACANRSFTLSIPNTEAQSWSTGGVTLTSGTLTETQRDIKGWVCQRALTARNNVVIDIVACGDNIAGQGVSIANQIAAKVPTT
jgi:serine/threonine kinase PknH